LLQGVDREKSQTCEASGTFCLGTPPFGEVGATEWSRQSCTLSELCGAI